jgi:hypothetical protein
MDRHRAIIGLAVGPADLDVIPLTVRWAYPTGPAPAQNANPRMRRWRLGKGSALLRALAWQTAHIAVWCRRAA